MTHAELKGRILKIGILNSHKLNFKIRVMKKNCSKLGKKNLSNKAHVWLSKKKKKVRNIKKNVKAKVVALMMMKMMIALIVVILVVLNVAYAKMAQMVGVMKLAGIRAKNVIMTGTTNVVVIGTTNVTISMTVSQEPVHLGSIIQILLAWISAMEMRMTFWEIRIYCNTFAQLMEVWPKMKSLL